jgi:hypothetical protein
MIEKVWTAVQAKALTVHFVKPLHDNESQSGHFMEDPTLDNRQKVAHRVEYCLNALLSSVKRLFKLFETVSEHVEDFALKNQEETANLVFHRRLRHKLVESHLRPQSLQGNDEGRVQHLLPRGGILPLRPRPYRDQSAETRRTTAKIEGSGAVLVRPLCEAIRAGNSNMQDVHRRNGGCHEDGGTGRVWFIHREAAQRNGHVQGQKQPRGFRRRYPSRQTALQRSPYHRDAQPRQTRTSLQRSTTGSRGQSMITQ